MTFREVASESVLIGAGGRAILLQLAHPAVGHGVARHSDFASRPLDRLHATLTYVYAVACGSEAEIDVIRRRVNRAHAPVHNNPHDEDSGVAYNAYTPELQLWVAATLYDSAITMHERVFGPLDTELADELYVDYARLGTTLQVPIELWPADRAAFAVYWDDQLSRLRTDETTRSVALQLLHPVHGPLLLRAAMPLGRLLTAGLLPEPLRAELKLPWTTRSARRFDRLIQLIAAVYPRLPRSVRHWPKNHYLRALRASMQP
ncbi:oxygenase MpaB family protein [Glaciibacter superstes]|uniref:oxygenase MpaB family protein n=1 Tax=Glaciibacter superstes TaxID=501023 RepID=UPI0003B43699|nr:oxygenase MpaB family protein [Glaciibacter superstes]